MFFKLSYKIFVVDIGNGTIIHSGGQSYAMSSSSETYEPTVRYKNLEDLFTEGDTCHLFGKVQYMKIVRPLKSWTGAVPENLINRINNMQGISAEKISSHNSASTANPGDEITYTFSIYNTNKTPVTLNISDVVDDNATYVSGAQSVSGKNLSWTVIAQPREKTLVTYKVRVNADAQIGTYLDNSKGKIGGVMVRCPDVQIKRTLTSAEQASIKTQINALKSSGLKGLAFVNEVYKNVLGVDNILYDYNNDGAYTYEDITGGVFMETS